MIEIREGAAKKIKSLMTKQGISDGGLRVGVKGGGCSGLSYTFAWEREPRLGDEGFEGPEGAKILQVQDRLLKEFPEAETVFGKMGKATTATDPAFTGMAEITAVGGWLAPL